MSVDTGLNFLSEHLTAVGVVFFIIFALRQVTRKSTQTHAARRILSENIEKKMNEPFTLHPEIDPELCLG